MTAEKRNQSRWMTLLGGAGLPRVGSLGFSDNYLVSISLNFFLVNDIQELSHASLWQVFFNAV
jgi:hypothetical protein